MNSDEETTLSFMCSQETSGILEVLDESSSSLPEHNPAELDEVLSKASAIIELPDRNENRLAALAEHDSICSGKEDSTTTMAAASGDGSSLVATLDQICADVEKQDNTHGLTKESNTLDIVNTGKCEYPGMLTTDSVDRENLDYSDRLKSPSIHANLTLEKKNISGELMLTESDAAAENVDDSVQLLEVSRTSGDGSTKIQDGCVDPEKAPVTVNDSDREKSNTLGGLSKASILPCDANVQFKDRSEELNKSSDACAVDVEMIDSPNLLTNVTIKPCDNLKTTVDGDSEEPEEPCLNLATKSNSDLRLKKECDDHSNTPGTGGEVSCIESEELKEVTSVRKTIVLDSSLCITGSSVNKTVAESCSETQKFPEELQEPIAESNAGMKGVDFIRGKKRTISDVLDSALVEESRSNASDRGRKCFKADTENIETSITGLPEKSGCKQRNLKVCLLEEDEEEDLELSTDTGEIEEKAVSIVEDLEDIIKPHVLVASHKNSSSSIVKEGKQMDTYDSDSSTSLYEGSGLSKQGHSYSAVKKTGNTSVTNVTTVDSKRKRIHTEWSESSNSSWETDVQTKVDNSYTVAKKVLKTSISKVARKPSSVDIKKKHFDEDWSDYSDSSWDRDVQKMGQAYTAVKAVHKDSNVSITIENVDNPLTSDNKEHPLDINRSDSSDSSVKISAVTSCKESAFEDGNKSIACVDFKEKGLDNICSGSPNSSAIQKDQTETANSSASLTISCDDSKSLSAADAKSLEIAENDACNSTVEQNIKSKMGISNVTLASVYKVTTVELTSDDGSNSLTAVDNSAKHVSTDERELSDSVLEQRDHPNQDSNAQGSKSETQVLTIDPEESLLKIFDDKEISNNDSSIGNKIANDSVEELLSSLTKSVTEVDNKKTLDISDNKSTSTSLKLSGHPKLGLSYKRVTISHKSQSLLKSTIDARKLGLTIVNKEKNLGSTDSRTTNSTSVVPTHTDSVTEISSKDTSLNVEQSNTTCSMKSGHPQVDNANVLETDTPRDSSTRDTSIDLNKLATAAPNSLLKQSERSAVRRAYIPVYGIPNVNRVSLPMGPFVAKDSQRLVRLASKSESSNTVSEQKEQYKFGHSKFVVRTTHSTMEDACKTATTAENSDGSKNESSSSSMDHNGEHKVKRSSSLVESTCTTDIAPKDVVKSAMVADKKEKHLGIKRDDSFTVTLELKDQPKTSISSIALGRSRRGSVIESAVKDASKIVINIDTIGAKYSDGRGSFAVEQNFRSIEHMEMDSGVQGSQNDPEIQVIEPEESLVKLFQETGSHENDTTAITATTTKESDDSVEDLILLLEDSPNTSRQVQTPTESPEECQIISVVDKTKEKENMSLRKQTRSVEQGRSVLTTRVRLQKVLEAAVKKHTGQTLSLIKKQKKTKKSTPGAKSDLVTKGRSKSDLVTKGPSKSDLVKKGPSKSDLVTKGPSKSDLVTKGPSKSDLVTKGPSKSDLVTKGPSKSDLVTKGPSKSDLVTKGPSKLREKIQTRAGKSEETSTVPRKQKLVQATRAVKGGKALINLQEKVLKVKRSRKSAEAGVSPDKKFSLLTRVTRSSPAGMKRRSRSRKNVVEEITARKRTPVVRFKRSRNVASNTDKLTPSPRGRPRKSAKMELKPRKKALSVARGTKSGNTTRISKNVVTPTRRGRTLRKIVTGGKRPKKNLTGTPVKSEETNISEKITHASDNGEAIVKKNKKSSPPILSSEKKDTSQPISRLKVKPLKDYRRKELRPCVVKLEDVARYTPLIKLREQKILTGSISNKDQEVNRAKRNEVKAKAKNKGEIDELVPLDGDIPRLSLSSRPVFTYRDLKRNVFQIDLPSILWATQVETTGRFVSFTRMSSDSNSFRAFMDKGVMFEGTCEPAVFFREKRIYLPVSKGEINSLEAVSDFLLRVHRVAFCVGGLQRGVFSKGCRGYVDVPNSDMRCSSCVAERKTVLAALNRRLSKRVIKPNTRFL